MKKTKSLVVPFLVISLISCNKICKKMPTLSIHKTQFGKTIDGYNVNQYILSNKKGMEIKILNYGGIITSWTAADKNGDYKDIVLGYKTLAEYEAEKAYFGALLAATVIGLQEGNLSLMTKNINSL